ncbi:MAG: aspartate carbamoyltransferase [Chloroflexi bacterium]|nr:aspartate carbamoyltransferase [Chloroflexota bacterium]MDA1271928.1 aspartate carbamoyltransferase [Chloroflexota bacterium]
MEHVLRAQQFDKKLIARVFDAAEEMETVVARGGSEELRGRIMASLFYAVSTRTRLSFESAMHRLGGSVISTENPQSFSDFASSGHFEDTISMVNQYADLIVLRHRDSGLVYRAADVSSIPVINAGGGEQHPTQALLDLYTIYRAIDGIDGVSVVLMGDLAHSGASRSLCYFLAKYSGIKLWLVSPKELALGEDLLGYLGRHEVRWEVISGPGPELDEALKKADVVYQTDLPQGHVPLQGGPPRQAFRIDTGMMRHIRERAIIMHPFPRVDSITPEVDSDPRAHYFQQISNGLFIRMALLQMLL